MKTLYRLTLVVVFLIILIVIIAFARGYRFNITEQKVTPTGILAISADPKASSVYINGKLKGATDLNVNLIPGKYQVDVKKEGYTTWSKTINVKPEIVLSLEATLFPKNPSLSPLTNIGIVKAIPIDQTDRIMLFSQKDDPKQDGIYLFEAGKKTIALTRPLKTILLAKDIPLETVDFNQAKVFFSPNYKQAIIEFDNQSFLISTEEEKQTPFDVSISKETLLTAWQEEKEKQMKKILESFPKDIAKIASDSFHIISFSPNEQKILYQSTKNVDLPLVKKPPLIGANQTKEKRSLLKNKIYVYDKKEDKNFAIDQTLSIKVDKNNLPDLFIADKTLSIQWYPDSKHLILSENKRISVTDYDGTNKQVIYSGPFESDFFSVTGTGRIVILANLNPENNKLPDLFLVGVR